jgi:signal transduction histidine kinase
MIKQEPIGVIEAVNKKGQEHYTEDDLTVLETLAAQAAIAIENARLLGKLQDANAELTRLDRMKSDFIAIASHELRTPLGLILGHSTFLKEVVPQQYQEQMDVIVRSSMRLKTIIEDLSTIAHKDEGQSRVRRAPFSISKLVVDMTERFRDTAKDKKIELGYDVPDGDPLMVQGDREKIDVALSNLVRNAVTFTDANGQVGIKAEGEGGYVKVFVVDTGIGIPAGEIERIFDRFYQVESHLTRKHGGMGLGLSIAKAMIEMHNGQIWCESKEGTGSLFCFMLPIGEKQAAAAAKVFRPG